MKIKFFLIALITFLVLTFSSGSFSVSPNDVQAATTSVSSVEDYTYERVFINGVWWIYVYNEGGELIAVYPDDD